MSLGRDATPLELFIQYAAFLQMKKQVLRGCLEFAQKFVDALRIELPIIERLTHVFLLLPRS
jgi:hypothetical protein